MFIETSNAYGRDLVEGVSSYLRTHGGWSVFLEPGSVHFPPPGWLARWQGDGILTRWTNPGWAKLLARKGLPAVDLNDHFGFLGLPRVGSDMDAIGRMAADHLLERGFHHIGFCGYEDAAWSEGRQAGVERAVEGRGVLCGVFNSPVPHKRKGGWERERDQLARWVAALPRPVGIVACSDVRGWQLLDAVRGLDIVVPEEVAVIGVDNDQTCCGIASPPLSSVRPNAVRIGYEAAALLDRLMAGRNASDQEILVPPQDVVLRQSTDVTAVADPLVARALMLIRSHACDGWTVEDLLGELRTTRTVLERRFRRHIGVSPHEQLVRVRASRVKQLLLETDWTLERIAEEAGYSRPEYLTVQFTRLAGEPPSKWRARYRVPSTDGR